MSETNLELKENLYTPSPKNIVLTSTNSSCQTELKYLSYSEFDLKYPRGPPLAQGNYGTIHDCDHFHVIKMFEPDPTLKSFLIELNVFSTLLHKCIIKPLAWTVKDGVGYFAMKRGLDIKEAYLGGKITIREIISDTLSAIAYLNERGIAHGDIKPDNIIFLNGRATIIDLGIAVRGVLNEDNQYYVTGDIYPVNYRDPEYYQKQYNNINCESYSLVATYLEIMYGEKYVVFGCLHHFEVDDQDVKWLLEQVKLPQKERLPIGTILQLAPDTLIVRRYSTLRDIEWEEFDQKKNFKPCVSEEKKEKVNSTEKIGKEDSTNKIEKLNEVENSLLLNIMGWLVETSYVFNITVRTLFLLLDLVHRTFPGINTYFHNNPTTNIYIQTKKNYLTLYSCAIMNMAILATATETFYDLGFWEKLFVQFVNKSGSSNNTTFTFVFAKDAVAKGFSDGFELITTTILNILNCVISRPTYWDYAKSKEDLYPLLLDTINLNYNPNFIRKLTRGTNKCISVKDFMSKEQSISFRGEYASTPLTLVKPVKIRPSQLDIKGKFSFVSTLLNEKNWLTIHYSISVPILLRNRDTLRFLDIKSAFCLFSDLFNYKLSKHLCIHVLNLITNFDWRTFGTKVLDLKLHPFRVKDCDLC
jgi:serine/threonine protein kinase